MRYIAEVNSLGGLIIIARNIRAAKHWAKKDFPNFRFLESLDVAAHPNEIGRYSFYNVGIPIKTRKKYKTKTEVK